MPRAAGQWQCCGGMLTPQSGGNEGTPVAMHMSWFTVPLANKDSPLGLWHRLDKERIASGARTGV